MCILLQKEGFIHRNGISSLFPVAGQEGILFLMIAVRLETAPTDN